MSMQETMRMELEFSFSLPMDEKELTRKRNYDRDKFNVLIAEDEEKHRQFLYQRS